MSVLLVGSGGHARVCAEILEDLGWPVQGCVNRDGVANPGFDVPVLGPDSELEKLIQAGATDVLVAIGDNEARLSLGRRVLAAGGRLISAVSPYAHLSASVRIGDGVVVMPGAVVNAGTVLGDLVIVNTNATVDHDCVLGYAVHIAPAAALAGGVRVGSSALIGIGARVIPGMEIGDQAVVGAGAVVIRPVPAGSTVVGVPARVRGASNA